MADDLAEPTFEDALRRLEAVVKKLENHDTPLNDAVDAYEEGMHLAKACMDLLDNAELRVQKIGIEEDGQ